MECELSKYLVTIPVPNKEAKTIARAIFENFILTYGFIKNIRSDMGTEYVNNIMKELMQVCETQHSISTPYRPQTVGTVERIHRVMNEYLRSYISSAKDDWDCWLKYFTYCYNTTPSTVHNYCPYELVFSRSPTLPADFAKHTIDPLYNVDNYAKEAKFRLQMAMDRARRYLQQAKEKRKLLHDKSVKELNIKSGDQVLLVNETGHKLEEQFNGPYTVISVTNNNCIVNISGKDTKVHKNRLRKYHS